MKKFMMTLMATIFTLCIFSGQNVSRVNAEVIRSNEKNIAMTPEQIEEADKINWSEVTEAVIVYNDFTTIPETLEEAEVLDNARIELRGMARSTTTPAYKDAVARAVWIKRADGWTLSLTMKWSTYSGSSIFEGIWSKHRGDSQWQGKNKNSMANQFYCHRDFVGSLKNPWNIEPWKNDKGYWGFVLGACN